MSASDTSEDKVSALMKMFEEEKARHRQAEMAAETRIRLLESKLKEVDLKNTGAATTPKTPRRTTTNGTPTATTSRVHTSASSSLSPSASKKNNNNNNNSQKRSGSKTRETVTGTEPRTSDSLFATPTKRKTFLPLSSSKNNNNNNNVRVEAGGSLVDEKGQRRKVAGSPSGSPSNVASLPRASSAATSRSERLAAARTKRKEEVQQQQQKQQRQPSPSSSSSTAKKTTTTTTPIRGRTRSFTPTATTNTRNTTTSSSNNKKSTTASASGAALKTWAGINPEHEKAWKRFCETAKGQFSSQELVAVASETLQQLMDHFAVTDPVERARVEAHWSYMNEMSNKSAPSSSSSLNQQKNAQQPQQRSLSATPHRKRVKELHFPEHPDDFNLRTTVPFDPTLTPRKALGPDALQGPRGCNIESHNFTCPERKMRSLTLLRPRSPATSNFGASALEQAAVASPARHKSKKMIDCDAKLTDRQDDKVQSKKFYESVPGQDNVERTEGKRRASAIPGTKVNSEEQGHSSKKMNVPKPKTDLDDNRRGIKIHVQDPTASKDAKRYCKNTEYAATIRTTADSTLSTQMMEKLVRQGAAAANTNNHSNHSSNIISSSLSSSSSSIAAPRSLVMLNHQQPTKFQLKTPFAVD